MCSLLVVPSDEKKITEVNRRVLALRSALGMTQEQLADAAGLTRTEINKLENGGNQGKSFHVVRGLAVATRVDSDTIGDYLDEALSLADVLAKRRPQMSAAIPAQKRPKSVDRKRAERGGDVPIADARDLINDRVAKKVHR